MWRDEGGDEAAAKLADIYPGYDLLGIQPLAAVAASSAIRAEIDAEDEAAPAPAPAELVPSALTAHTALAAAPAILTPDPKRCSKTI